MMTGRLVILVLLGVFTLQTEYICAIAFPLEKTSDPKIDKTLIFNGTIDDSSNNDRPSSVSTDKDKPEVGENSSEISVALTRKKRAQTFSEVPSYTVLYKPPVRPTCLNCKYEPPSRNVPVHPEQNVQPTWHYSPRDMNVYNVVRQPTARPTCPNCRYEVNPPLHIVPGNPVQNVHPTRHNEVTPSARYGPGNSWLYQTSVRPICLNCKYEPPSRNVPVNPVPYGPSKGPTLYKIQPLSHPPIVY